MTSKCGIFSIHMHWFISPSVVPLHCSLLKNICCIPNISSKHFLQSVSTICGAQTVIPTEHKIVLHLCFFLLSVKRKRTPLPWLPLSHFNLLIVIFLPAIIPKWALWALWHYSKTFFSNTGDHLSLPYSNQAIIKVVAEYLKKYKVVIRCYTAWVHPKSHTPDPFLLIIVSHTEFYC